MRHGIHLRAAGENRHFLILTVAAGACALGGCLLTLADFPFQGILLAVIGSIPAAFSIFVPQGSRRGWPAAAAAGGALLLYFLLAFQMKSHQRFYIGLYAVPFALWSWFGLAAAWQWLEHSDSFDRRIRAAGGAAVMGYGIWMAVRSIPDRMYGIAGLFLAGTVLWVWLGAGKDRETCRKPNRLRVGMMLFLAGALLLVFLKNAWIGEDAYITFRVIDNFIHGFGLRWNAAERVQAFTHPLWLLCMSAGYYFTREPYYTSLALSWLCVLAAVILVVRNFAARGMQAIAALLLLTFSKAFMDYASSGLETPLTYLLLAAFYSVYLHRPEDRKSFWQLNLIAALAAMNRMDTLLLTTPALLYRLWKSRPCARGERTWLQSGFLRYVTLIATAWLPFIVWEAFAILYYGFPFPNTAYAKLNTGLSAADSLAAGWNYFADSVLMDPITLLVIFVAPAVAAAGGALRRQGALFAGLGLYAVYVLRIGGDYMSGRFFAAPFLGAVILLLDATEWNAGTIAAALVALLPLSLVSPGNPWNTDRNPSSQASFVAIADERAYYFGDAGLVNIDPRRPLPEMEMSVKGREWRERGPGLHKERAVGMAGYCAGPQVHILDPLALTEPLLARLPCLAQGWWNGHFMRLTPAGYLETLNKGKNCLRDPRLAAYYERLRLIVRGPLWGRERLATILRMNLGMYKREIDRERYRGIVTLPLGKRCLVWDQGVDGESGERVEDGILAAVHGDWETAGRRWREAEAAKPQYVGAQAALTKVTSGNLAVWNEQQGNTAEAVRLYAVAARAWGEPWSGYYRTLRARLPEETRRTFPERIDKVSVLEQTRRFLIPPGGDDYGRLVQHGILAGWTGAKQTAEQYFSEAVKLAPERPQARINLGILQEEQGNLEDALRNYQCGLRRIGRPCSQWAEQVRRKIKKQERRMDAKTTPAAGAKASGATPAGYSPRDLASASGASVYARNVNDGVRALMSGDGARAEYLWREAQRLNPDGAEALADLAVLHEARGEFGAAWSGYDFAARRLGQPWAEYRRQVEGKMAGREERPSAPGLPSASFH